MPFAYVPFPSSLTFLIFFQCNYYWLLIFVQPYSYYQVVVFAFQQPTNFFHTQPHTLLPSLSLLHRLLSYIYPFAFSCVRASHQQQSFKPTELLLYSNNNTFFRFIIRLCIRVCSIFFLFLSCHS